MPRKSASIRLRIDGIEPTKFWGKRELGNVTAQHTGFQLFAVFAVVQGLKAVLSIIRLKAKFAFSPN